MKKRVMAVVAALAVMCFGTTALAAGSPTAGTTTANTTVAAGQEAQIKADAPTVEAKDMVTTTTVTAGDVKVDAKAVANTTVTETVTQAGNLLTDLNALAAVVEKGDATGASSIKAAATNKDAKVTASVKTVLNLEATVGDKPVTVTVKNNEILAGKTYVVLHYVGGKTLWETLPATVTKSGELTFTTTTFSPFAVVEISVDEASKPVAETPVVTTNGADASTSTGTSPKTGESASFALIALLLCAAGALVSVKKLEQA